MIFVTASDKNYFDILLAQVVAVREHFGTLPTVYDLGLLPSQKRILENAGIALRPQPPSPKEGDNYPCGYRPRALFKPMIMMDVCAEHPNEGVVYLDADARPTKHFSFPPGELALVKVKDMSSHGGKEEYIGPFHAGVIYLAASPKRMDFLIEWNSDMWADPLPSDTKSLNNVAPGDLDMVALGADEYCADKIYPSTKILHHKDIFLA